MQEPRTIWRQPLDCEDLHCHLKFGLLKLIGVLQFNFQVPSRDSSIQPWHTPEPVFAPTSATDALYDHGIDMDLEISCPLGPLNSGSMDSIRHPFRTTQFEPGQPSASFSELALDFEDNFLAVDFD